LTDDKINYQIHQGDPVRLTGRQNQLSNSPRCPYAADRKTKSTVKLTKLALCG